MCLPLVPTSVRNCVSAIADSDGIRERDSIERQEHKSALSDVFSDSTTVVSKRSSMSRRSSRGHLTEGEEGPVSSPCGSSLGLRSSGGGVVRVVWSLALHALRAYARPQARMHVHTGMRARTIFCSTRCLPCGHNAWPSLLPGKLQQRRAHPEGALRCSHRVQVGCGACQCGP